MDNNEFITIFDTGYERLRAKVKYVGGKESGVHFDFDNSQIKGSDRYNIVELEFNDNIKLRDTGVSETFEVWGEEHPNLENNLLEALDIIFGFASMAIKGYDEYLPYEDFCSNMDGNLWDIDIAISYARTCGYIHKLENIGFSLAEIKSFYDDNIDGATSLQEVRESYESSMRDDDEDYYNDYDFDEDDNEELSESTKYSFSRIYKKSN